MLAVLVSGITLVPADAPRDWIGPDEIAPGMRAVVRTVLQGTRQEELQVELLGVLDDGIGPGTPMILGRFVDEKGRWTGVAAGMSGSPVYVGDRLLGALSYAIGAFAREPICGITPIGAMAALEHLPAGGPPRTGRLTPTPLVLVGRGFGKGALEEVERLLAERGFAVRIASGSAMQGATAAPAMAPGDPVAALLVWGDVVLGATGTITWRRDDTLLAFGHPFLGSGRIALPMASAEIIWTVPSNFNSFKIARIGKPVGIIEQDRLTAIRGRLGPVPEGIPLNVTIVRRDGAPVERRMYLARDELLTPVLGAVSSANAVSREVGAERDEALSLRLVAHLAGGRDVTTEIAAAGPGDVQKKFVGEINTFLGRLTAAPVELPPIRGIDVRVTRADRAGGFEIVRATPDRLVARPGEPLAVHVDLEGPRGLRRRSSLRLRIPERARPGRYVLLVGSARAVEGKFGNLDEAVRRTAANAEEYLAAMERRPSDATLEARLALPAEGIVARGRKFPALPATAHLLMRSRPGGGKRMYRSRYVEVARARQSLERPVDKVVAVAVRVAGSAGRRPESGDQEAEE